MASAALAVFVLVVALDLSKTVPRETTLAFDLGPDHALVRAIALSYAYDGNTVLQASRRYPHGAPTRLRETLDLVPDRYRVRLELTYLDGHVVTREGEFEAPGEGVIVVHLEP